MKVCLKTADSWVLRIFLYGLPLASCLAIFCASFGEGRPTLVWQKSLYDFAGIIFGLWMIFSLYISGRLIFSRLFREQILGRLVFLQERDEREVQLTGRATKGVFLSGLAVLICLLCLSVFRVSVERLPPNQAIDGKTGTISLGLEFSPVAQTISMEKEKYVRYQGLPISNAGLILFLILFQIGGYNLLMRKKA